MGINEVLQLTPKQAFIFMLSWHRDRADIVETAGKLVAAMFGQKWKSKPREDSLMPEKLKPLPSTPNLDRISQGHIEKLQEMKRKRAG